MVSSWQMGVIRTNCMDNLDRTNVVQSLFMRRSLLWQLNKAETEDVMNTPYSAFEKSTRGVGQQCQFHVSQLRRHRSSESGLHEDRKVTMKGKYNDSVNAVKRYFLNNFFDAEKQDSIDILLGNFRPKFSNPSPFTRGPQFLPMSMFLMALLLGPICAVLAARKGHVSAGSSTQSSCLVYRLLRCSLCASSSCSRRNFSRKASCKEASLGNRIVNIVVLSIRYFISEHVESILSTYIQISVHHLHP